MQPLSIKSWPRAIAHVDGDAFFVSCEISRNPDLKGKPVVTGQERGIASALSYEAKARGVRRGMPIHEIKRICPDVIVLPSDYETYSLYAERMYAIVRRHSPQVEEYSIDECFADLTGLRGQRHKSYEDIAMAIKHDLDNELGMTFSMGIAPTKVLAKVASKHNKPDGFVVISGKKIEQYLRDLPLDGLWGIGIQTKNYLNKLGLHTALSFAQKSEDWVRRHLSKPYQELWWELRAVSIFPVNTERKTGYKSISKTRTFTPASTDNARIFSELARNIENACTKARRYGLAPKEICFLLTTQSFQYSAIRLTLSAPTTVAGELITLARSHWSEIYKANTRYRKTGVVLSRLEDAQNIQHDLFGASQARATREALYNTADELAKRYGKHIVHTAASLSAITDDAHGGGGAQKPVRASTLFVGKSKRRRLDMAYLGEVS
ncbi:MAG: DNA polymerase IV [bacterium]|nr:DNA polymerase IV [bacterium]